MGPSKLEEFQSHVALPPYEVSAPCRKLLSKLSQCAPSSNELRKVIRSDVLEKGVNFDLVLHSYLNFVETFVNHLWALRLFFFVFKIDLLTIFCLVSCSLGLMYSPRNPLRERTAAVHTTIHIPNNPFLSDNDKIELEW